MPNQDRQAVPDEPFDATAPIGGFDATPPPSGDSHDALSDPARDRRLDALVAQATQPPADLGIDLNRLHAAMAGVDARRRGSATAWRFRTVLAGSAIAAALVLTTVIVLHRPGQTTNPGQPAVAVQPQTPQAPTLAVADAATARQIIDAPRQPRDTSARVVYLRQTPKPREAVADAGGSAGPIVMANYAATSGSPKTRSAALNVENDMASAF